VVLKLEDDGEKMGALVRGKDAVFIHLSPSSSSSPSWP
jgi:hypothetical protein